MNDINKKIQEKKISVNEFETNKQDIQDNLNKKDKSKNEINDFKMKIFKIKKNISEIKLREQAEIDNINKKYKEKIKKIKNNQLENFFKNLVPIIENLINIRNTINKLGIEHYNIVQGIPLILKSLLDNTKQFGLITEGKKGKLFNPLLHQPEKNDILNNNFKYYITEVISYGYVFKEKVIKKAYVKLSKHT